MERSQFKCDLRLSWIRLSFTLMGFSWRDVYAGGLDYHSQVARMLQAGRGRGGKQQQKQHSPNLGTTFLHPCTYSAGFRTNPPGGRERGLVAREGDLPDFFSIPLDLVLPCWKIGAGQNLKMPPSKFRYAIEKFSPICFKHRIPSYS